MGKGYNNFMSKKAFHPGSFANQKRIKEAEEKAAAKRKHDEDTLAQYQKEQELFQQRSLVSRESKDKLSLSFMYDAPPNTSQNKNKLDPSFAGESSTKWKQELQVKREAPLTRRTNRAEDHSPSLSSSSSHDDEQNIVLTWSREEPKAKKRVKTEK